MKIAIDTLYGYEVRMAEKKIELRQIKARDIKTRSGCPDELPS